MSNASSRSRIEEIKALRIRLRRNPINTKIRKNLSSTLASNIKSIISSAENSAERNSKLVISKPSVALFPPSRKNFKSASKRAEPPKLNLSNLSLNNSLNSVKQTFTQRSARIPKPPEKSPDRIFTRKNSYTKSKAPFTPRTALQHKGHHLSEFEKIEIKKYKEVYFLGNLDLESKNEEGPNFGFDDERGDYKLYKGDHIAYRYEIISMLGKGSFGQVCECFDHKEQVKVAVKVIKNHKKFENQAAVEIKLLNTLKLYDQNDSNNVIHMKDYFKFRKHVCIAFEKLNKDLYELLKSNKLKGLSLGLIRRFAVQILIGLRFLKKLCIIHCDLKPENILLKHQNKSGIKIIDFGSACFNREKIYSYIQSRFYRAPEIILGIPYNSSIDMWSFGCILAELYTGKPLFPGESEMEQLQLIMQLLGAPPNEVLNQARRREMFFHKDSSPRLVPSKKGKVHEPSTKTLQEATKTSDEQFLDLIHKCLEWDPELRIKPEEALKHPWVLEGIPKPSEEPPKSSRTLRKRIYEFPNHRRSPEKKPLEEHI